MSDRIETNPALLEWLLDYEEQPWRRFVSGLKERGQLVDVAGVMVDARALFATRFCCDSKTCAMVDRPEGVESCCEEYFVEVTLAERDRITRRGAEVVEFLSRKDPARVKPDRDISSFFDDRNTIELLKEDNRCVFSYRDEAGQLWCGLHSLAMEKGWPIESIKPTTCILFPLVVFRFENGEMLLTATSEEVERMFANPKESLKLPCLLKQAGDPMYVECRSAIETAFGKPFYARLESAARDFLNQHPVNPNQHPVK
jgi:Fe-S-cluster containining protein